MPASSGSPLRMNGWSTRAKTNGTTGRMHGARIVSIPARYDNANSVMADFEGMLCGCGRLPSYFFIVSCSVASFFIIASLAM